MEGLPDRPNVVLLITDQERPPMHWPEGFAEEHLPSLARLKAHGVSFENSVCNTAMCSPSRATLFTGRMPAQHHVTDTLTEAGRFAPTDTVLDPSIPNLATMMRERGYRVEYRGKWHLSKGRDPEAGLTAADLAEYGFDGWQPPDAGGDIRVHNFGGGKADHDGDYLSQSIEFLEAAAAEGHSRQPFCLIISLVNPHDVLAFPPTWSEGGYTEADLEGPIGLPANVHEDHAANLKPPVQVLYAKALDAVVGKSGSDEARLKYVNFYANLIVRVDRQIAPVVDLLYDADGTPTELGESTILIRTSDHGELAYAHGLRQKAFNVYEESIRVPLIVSNPLLAPEARTTAALASLVDLVPTIAGLTGATAPEGAHGADLSPIVRDPGAEPVQTETVFTFDDIRAGVENVREAIPAANRIRCIREPRWKYARYFHADGSHPEAFELYDRDSDPLEMENLAHPRHPRYTDPEVAAERSRLAEKLADRERLLALPG